MNAPRPTDVLLWRARLEPGTDTPQRLALPDGLRPSRIAWNPAERLLYVYAPLAQRESISAAVREPLAPALSVDGRPAAKSALSRLERVLDLPGASSTATPLIHYAVETDAEIGWMDEIARWYELEHLPGLASVPGCVRATRFVNHDGGPVSLACYDLTRHDVIETAPWLAARGSQWSGQTRPHFRNTRRTLFDVLNLETR